MAKRFNREMLDLLPATPDKERIVQAMDVLYNAARHNELQPTRTQTVGQLRGNCQEAFDLILSAYGYADPR